MTTGFYVLLGCCFFCFFGEGGGGGGGSKGSGHVPKMLRNSPVTIFDYRITRFILQEQADESLEWVNYQVL